MTKLSGLIIRKKVFFTKSMYRILTFGGIRDADLWEIWKCKLPLKIKHFLFLVGKGRLPCAEQLVKRYWKGVINSVNCVVMLKLPAMFSSVALWQFLLGVLSKRP